MKSEKIIENRSINIANGVIKEIGDFTELSINKEDEVFDGRGMYLTPGFSDMHVHTYLPEESLLFLANGVTRIRNMWGFPEHISYRENIRRGEILAPELFTTGPLTDGLDPLWENSYILTDTNKVEEYVNKIKDEGYDFIKIYDKISQDVFFKIMEVANKVDIPVVGHIPFNVDIKDAINSNLASIEHFTGYDLKNKNIDEISDVIELTLESGVWNCPTLLVIKNLCELTKRNENPELYRKESLPNLKYVPKATIDMWSSQGGYDFGYDNYSKLIKHLYDRGGNIVSGSDTLNPYIVSGFSIHEEFELMDKAGLTPFQILETTTINPAKMLGIDNRAGTIEVGKDADLVLLKENPLEDIANTRTIEAVIVKGKLLDKKSLEDMLKEVEMMYTTATIKER